MEEQEIIAEQNVEQEIEVSENVEFSLSDEMLAEQGAEISGNELIDATQNAIVGAAENVSEALTLTENTGVPHEDVPLYQDVEFWVGMSFVLVVLMIAKPLWRAIKQGLNNSIKAIITQIDEAVKLRDDAQKLLADYEKRCNDVDERVAQITEQANKNIASYRERELKNMQRELDRKQKEVQARIERSMQVAKDEINASLSARAITLAQKAIETNLKDDDKIRLIDEAIADLDSIKR